MAKLALGALIGICLVATISAGAVPPEFAEFGPEVRKVCLEETGADEALIAKANDGDISSDEKFKCYMKCALHQFGIITRKGINFETMVRLAPPLYKDKVREVTDACKNTKATKEGDMCDLVYEVSKCFYSRAPKYYFLL